MVTKLADGRGQMTLKGKEVTDGWEALVKQAAADANLSVAAWIVAITSRAAGQPTQQQQLGGRLDRLGQDLAALVGLVERAAGERRAQHQELLDCLRHLDRQTRRHR
jgi:hypothetical protein